MTTTDELLDRIEQLEEEQAELRAQYQQTKSQYEQVTGLFEQFKTGKISRRAFLGSVTALAGVGFAAGNASAAPDWNNTNGYAGTEAQPLIGVNASSGTFESVSTDETATNLQDTVSTTDSGVVDGVAEGNTSVGTSATEILADADFAVMFVYGYDSSDNNIRFIDRLATSFNSVDDTNLHAVNGPAGRTYSMDGTAVELAMGSDTYDVVVDARRFDR